MSYKVKLDNFEGPFDLLCYLIENAEMNIYDIQVSVITKQYLACIVELQSQDLAVGGEFMVLAAALIELKSKMLLPRAKKENGEPEEDPRSELVQKLLEYRKFKSVAELLLEQEERACLLFEKPQEDLQPYTGEPDEYLRMDLDQFVQAFRLFIMRKQRVEEVRRRYERVEQQRETVETRISFIKKLFGHKQAKRLRFRELLRTQNDRFDIVLTFVSLLEMIRSKTVRVKQKGNFAEITVELRGREESGDA
ncbi:MAG: segregation/condensation protein A [Clostridiales Family XIII bacterium]|jgi:segregation and condensation protein A|nr:segregation/condensation protein A [Clostridiales Family XIII bacterium]